MIRVAIGELLLDIDDPDAEREGALAHRFARFLAASPPSPDIAGADAVLRLEGADAPTGHGDLPRDEVHVTPLPATLDELAFLLTRGDFRCELRRAAGRWSGVARISDASAGAAESCVRILLAAALLDHGRLLVHAAGVGFRDGASAEPPRAPGAAVLFGPSGAGKSTFALLARTAGEEILGDDLVVIGAHPSGSPHAWGTPFSGDPEAPGHALCRRLGGLFALVHGSSDELAPLAPGLALSRLLARAVTYRPDPRAAEAILEIAGALLPAVRAWSFAFRPTGAAVALARRACTPGFELP